MKDFFEKVKQFLFKNKSNFLFWVFISIFFIALNFSASLFLLNGVTLEDNNISYNEFKTMVSEDCVKSVSIDLEGATFSFETLEGEVFTTDNPKIDDFKEYLLKNDIEVNEIESSGSSSIFDLLRLGLTIGLMVYLFKMMAPRTKNDMNKKVSTPEISFKDIAGNKELKKDMSFIVEFLKDPSKMEKAGARMPNGVILYGPPGTGKTLVAKAIAGEAGVPFYSATGSGFVEMFVGLGAKRIRDLYAEARKNTPCIVFIDEIDAVGGKRGSTDSNSEREQTLNALLTELDGFKSSDGIITICATNRVEDLDPALTRPGRFDRQMAVNLPDKDDRREIIEIYTQNRKYAEDVDFDDLAATTTGFSGADIEGLMNEAAILTAEKGNTIITNQEIEDAFFKIVMKGNKKENQSARDRKELKLVAWHEAGHTLATKLLTEDNVTKVTILASTSGAGGVTFRNPPESQLHSKEYIEQSIKIMYGGRAAEEILYDGDSSKITTGAYNDIQQATKLIRKYISSFGMDKDFGMLNLEELMGKTLINSMNDEMLKTASELSNRLYKETLDLLNEHKELLKLLAEELLEKETLKSDDINLLIDNYFNKDNCKEEDIEIKNINNDGGNDNEVF